MSRRFKIRRQRPIKGGRERLYAAVERRVKDRVDYLAAKFHCTSAMVETTLLCDALGEDLPTADRFDSRPEHLTVVKKRA